MLKLAPWKHPDLLAAPSLSRAATPPSLFFKAEFLFQVKIKKKMLLLGEGYDGAQDTGLYPYMQVLKGAMKPIMELPFFLLGSKEADFTLLSGSSLME